jgi:hypothetical protein
VFPPSITIIGFTYEIFVSHLSQSVSVVSSQLFRSRLHTINIEYPLDNQILAHVAILVSDHLGPFIADGDYVLETHT